MTLVLLTHDGFMKMVEWKGDFPPPSYEHVRFKKISMTEIRSGRYPPKEALSEKITFVRQSQTTTRQVLYCEEP